MRDMRKARWRTEAREERHREISKVSKGRGVEKGRGTRAAVIRSEAESERRVDKQKRSTAQRRTDLAQHKEP